MNCNIISCLITSVTAVSEFFDINLWNLKIKLLAPFN